MKGIAGKTVIVSGGATSLGAAIARAFHGNGASVVIADVAERGQAALWRRHWVSVHCFSARMSRATRTSRPALSRPWLLSVASISW